MDLLSGLNHAQKEAVLFTEGPLLIVAGAGAGKTKTLTHRVAHLIKTGIAPEHILAITFTNKAAKEMRERADALLGVAGVTRRPLFVTFHALGVLLLRQEGHRLGIPRAFSIADESETNAFIKEAMKKEGIDPKQYEPKKIRGIISREKGNGMTHEDYAREVASGFGDIVASVWRSYERVLVREHALDFDDLLLKSWQLLDGYEDVREKYRDRFRYIHVDEYQDTNELQYRLVRLLVGPEENICVVGDSDQNIYSWRGANIKNILNFEQDFPRAKVVVLEENYRSTKTILAAANEVIKKNEMRKEKNLFTSKADGDIITVCECADEVVEGSYIASVIEKAFASGIRPNDIAILYRANFQSRVLEEAMLRANIPYHVLGTKFFERKEIKDVLAYIRVAQNPDAMNDLRRIINIPARGIGEKTFEKVVANERGLLPDRIGKKVDEFFALMDRIREQLDTLSPSDLVKYIVVESGIEKALLEGSDEDKERLENIRELVTVAGEYDGEEDALIHFLDNAALVSDQDSLMQDGGGVRLMTVHAAKGLEFRIVFITGLEQDLFPHAHFGDRKSKEEKEEERRLMYVAITRAKEKLYLTHASMRTIYGAREIHVPSEFLLDIPDDLHECEWRLSRESDTGGGRGSFKTIYLD